MCVASLSVRAKWACCLCLFFFSELHNIKPFGPFLTRAQNQLLISLRAFRANTFWKEIPLYGFQSVEADSKHSRKHINWQCI